MLFKERSPLVRPLLVDVVFPALEWNRCGEQDKGGQSSQSLNEGGRAVWRKVLSNFQRYCQVKGTL
jgi:hypothetical protein